MLLCRPQRPRRRRRSKHDKETPQRTQHATTISSTVGMLSLFRQNSRSRYSTSPSETCSDESDEIPLLQSHRKDDLARRQRRQILENGLLQAVQTGDIAQARVFLRQGESGLTGSTELNGQNLLYIAVRQRNGLHNTEMIQLLLHHGADVNAVTQDGQHTALHVACRMNEINTVNVLLAAGAHVNARNATGTTPLYWAAKLGFPELAQLLLDKGARIQQPFSPSPLEVAHHTVLPLLRKATFWGLVLTKQGFRSHDEWLGRLVAAIETTSQAQILNLLLKLSHAQGFVTKKQAQMWMQQSLEKLLGSTSASNEPEPPGWRALVHDCRQEGLLSPMALSHAPQKTLTSPRLLHNCVQQITLGLAFLEELKIALTQNPVHLAALDGSADALYKHLLLFCRALLRIEAARAARLPHLTETCGMEVAARAVVLVLQLAQMGRNCPTLTAVWGHLHWLNQSKPIEGMLLSVPAARRAMARGQGLGRNVLHNLDEEHVYVPLSHATADVGVLLGVVTTLLEHGVVHPLNAWGAATSEKRQEEKDELEPIVILSRER